MSLRCDISGTTPICFFGQEIIYVLTHELQDDGRHLSGYRGERRAPTQGPRCSVPHECVDPPAGAHGTPQRLTGTGAVSLRKPENEHDGMPPFRALSFKLKIVPSLCLDSRINKTVTGLNIPTTLHHVCVTMINKFVSEGK